MDYETLKKTNNDSETQYEQIVFLNTKLDAIRHLIISAGVPERYVTEVKEGVTQDTIEWVNRFIVNFVRPLEEAIALRPKEIWERYKAMGTNGLAEQLIRIRAEKRVRIAWHARPYPLKTRRDK